MLWVLFAIYVTIIHHCPFLNFPPNNNHHMYRKLQELERKVRGGREKETTSMQRGGAVEGYFSLDFLICSFIIMDMFFGNGNLLLYHTLSIRI